MITFLIRRVSFMCVSMVAITILSFVLLNLPPGSALDLRIEQMRARGGDITREQIRALEDYYGLNDPAYVKFTKWITHAVHGEFGQSFIYDQPVKNLIWERLAFSVMFSLLALIVTWVIAIPVGVYSATHRFTLPDYLVSVLQFVGLSVPEFLLALVLLVIASRVFNLDVVGVMFSKEYKNAPWSAGKVLDLAKHIWLPVVVIATTHTAGLTRIMRANLLDVLGQQYVQTARSKGVQEDIVIWKHAVRNALHPLIMSLGGILPALISGEAIVATVLNLPTAGPLYLQALINKDMYLAITILLMLSLLLLIGNLLADLLLAWVDPRVRLE